MFLAAILASSLMLTIIAGPAFVFRHAFLPGGTCGQSENAGGNNPTATSAIKTHNPAQDQRLPLPPTSMPAAAHPKLITNPLQMAEYPAPQK
jgi:hypothetical protein